MGDLFQFPTSSTPINVEVPGFGEGSDEIGTILLCSDDKSSDVIPIVCILSPSQRINKSNWNNSLEAKWQWAVRKAMHDVVFGTYEDEDLTQYEDLTQEELLASMGGIIILLWNPIFKETEIDDLSIDRMIMGAEFFEVIRPGIITEPFEQL
jgi:hypothetical protein